ncbi:MAG: hypothetical protein AB1540_04450 [Bdellovibrionota bacterium]
MEEKLATKDDLKDLKIELTHRMDQLRSELVIKIGTMIAGSVALTTTLITTIIKLT